MSTENSDSPRVLHQETLRAGAMWSRVLKRGQVLRLVDLEGGACVAALLYNARQPLERYNMPDTLKAQHVARLTRGYVLYSDMGRILGSIIEDTCGWHDTISGHADAAWTEGRYGRGSYQSLRNDWYRNTHDNFLVELGKHGLGKRDIVPNVNFFAKVEVDLEGKMAYVPGNSKAGDVVAMRADSEVLVVLSNTPHPLDPSAKYAPGPVALTVQRGQVAGPGDECRNKRPENARGFELTEDYYAE